MDKTFSPEEVVLAYDKCCQSTVNTIIQRLLSSTDNPDNKYQLLQAMAMHILKNMIAFHNLNTGSSLTHSEFLKTWTVNLVDVVSRAERQQKVIDSLKPTNSTM